MVTPSQNRSQPKPDEYSKRIERAKQTLERQLEDIDEQVLIGGLFEEEAALKKQRLQNKFDFLWSSHLFVTASAALHEKAKDYCDDVIHGPLDMHDSISRETWHNYLSIIASRHTSQRVEDSTTGTKTAKHEFNLVNRWGFKPKIPIEALNYLHDHGLLDAPKHGGYGLSFKGSAVLKRLDETQGSSEASHIYTYYPSLLDPIKRAVAPKSAHPNKFLM